MTTGDAAAAAGLSVVPATKDYRLGYDDINRRGDELANHMTNGGHPFSKISGQVKTAQLADKSVTTAKLADGAVTLAKLADAPRSTTGITQAQDHWTTGETPNYGWKYAGGMASIRVNARRSSGGTLIFDSHSGEPSDAAAGLLATAWRPYLTWYGIGKYIDVGTGHDFTCTVAVNPDGEVRIVSGVPGTAIGVNATTGYVSIEYVFAGYPLAN